MVIEPITWTAEAQTIYAQITLQYKNGMANLSLQSMKLQYNPQTGLIFINLLHCKLTFKNIIQCHDDGRFVQLTGSFITTLFYARDQFIVTCCT